MTDEPIVDLYFSRDETVVLHTWEKYGRYCDKIDLNFLSNSPLSTANAVIRRGAVE